MTWRRVCAKLASRRRSYVRWKLYAWDWSIRYRQTGAANEYCFMSSSANEVQLSYVSISGARHSLEYLRSPARNLDTLRLFLSHVLFIGLFPHFISLRFHNPAYWHNYRCGISNSVALEIILCITVLGHSLTKPGFVHGDGHKFKLA